jgi:hypothetical protein
MVQLEAQHTPAQRPLSDEEMAGLEAQHAQSPEMPENLLHGGLIRTQEGRAQHAISPEGLQETNEQVYGQGGLTPEKVGAAAGNALSLGLPGMGGVKSATSGLAEWLGGKLGTAGKVARGAQAVVPVAEDAAIAAATSPGDRAGAATQAAGTSALMRGISPVLGKAGDFLAQKAAGIKNTRAGQGNTLMEQGVWGTKGMQSGQVAKKIGERGIDLDAAVNSITDPISAKNVVDNLRAEAAKLEIGGNVASNERGLHKQYTDLADSIEKMGAGENVAMVSEDLHRLKQGQGDVAHNAKTGLVPDTDKAAAANLAKKESRQALSDAYASSHPGQPNEYEVQNANLATLFGAKRGLSNKTGLGDLAELGALTGLGYATGGTEGAAKAALLKSALVKSAAAHGSRGLSKAAAVAASPVSRTLFRKEEDSK